MAEAATAPSQKIVEVSLVDMYVPSIPQINTDDVKLLFPYQKLTKIEGNQEYDQMCVVRE